MLIQQGDVLIQSIDKIPSNLKNVKQSKKGYVLADGEITGHAHVIVDDDIEMMCDEVGSKFIANDHTVEVVHEEHGMVEIPAGTWKIDIVKEYDHFAEEARKVRD
jgi:hypothetical protein